MNKSLRQLFTIVVALFVILGMSTTIIMAIRANQLTNDARNVRALYHEYGAPRGSILAADGSVIAKSDPSNDSFSYQRSYSAGELYAPVTGFFSISQRGWSGVEASRSSLLSGQSEQLLWQRFKSLFTGQENKGANIETSIDPKIQQAAYNSLGSTDGAAVAIEPKTGRILAMVSTPSYDPNQLASHDMSQFAAVSSGVHVQNGGGRRGFGNRPIPAGYADSGRSKLHASRHRHATDQRRTAGRRR